MAKEDAAFSVRNTKGIRPGTGALRLPAKTVPGHCQLLVDFVGEIPRREAAPNGADQKSGAVADVDAGSNADGSSTATAGSMPAASRARSLARRPPPVGKVLTGPQRRSRREGRKQGS